MPIGLVKRRIQFDHPAGHDVLQALQERFRDGYLSCPGGTADRSTPFIPNHVLGGTPRTATETVALPGTFRTQVHPDFGMTPNVD